MPGSAWPHWIPSDGRDDPEMEISGMPLPACHSGIVSGCSWWWGWLLWDYQPHFTGGEASARNKPGHGEGGGCAPPELMMLFISILTARARRSCRHPAGGRTRLLWFLFPRIRPFTRLFCLQPLELAAFSLPVGTAWQNSSGSRGWARR